METIASFQEPSLLLSCEAAHPFSSLKSYQAFHGTLDYPVKFYIATDHNNTRYMGRSYLSCSIKYEESKQSTEFNIWFFDSTSETTDASIKSYAQFHHNELSVLPEIFKKEIIDIGGFWMDIKSSDIKNRIETGRSCSQKSVMKKSALNAFYDFFKEYEFFLSTRERMYWLYSLDKTKYPNIFYPEWCHCYAYSLSRFFYNPQTSQNLAAAPRWFNNAMLVIERVIQHVSLWSDQSQYPLKISFKSQFNRCKDIALSGEIRARFEHTIYKTSIEIVCPLSSSRPLLLTQASDSLAIAHIVIESLEKKPRYALSKK